LFAGFSYLGQRLRRLIFENPPEFARRALSICRPGAYTGRMWRWGKGRAAMALGLACAAAPALALVGDRAADVLAKLERGRWQVRSASQAAVQHSVCLGDPALLLQLEHGLQGCTQQRVATSERNATVEYVCPGRGFGHSTIRIETSTAATIDTQGFVDGHPFSYRATARKLSDC
jgi:hypothetical protein